MILAQALNKDIQITSIKNKSHYENFNFRHFNRSQQTSILYEFRVQ